MKIIGGKYKGRNIYMPKDIRPTQNLTRKALFDILGQELEGMDFLDLFAGSGAVGLEALSRGARSVTFVEKNPLCLNTIQENVNLLKLNMSAVKEKAFYEVIEGDSFATIKQLSRKGKKYHLVFLDPPYGRGLVKKALKLLSAYDILTPASMLIVEHEKKEFLPKLEGKLKLLKQNHYGNTCLSIFLSQS